VKITGSAYVNLNSKGKHRVILYAINCLDKGTTNSPVGISCVNASQC
jgi:hypothetical protein